ncbi:MAG: hypothetical protein R3F02_06005 [Thiolinea sp.]
MNFLPETLKTILNALALQHAGDYLSEEAKQENLARALERIHSEQAQQEHANEGAAVTSADLAYHNK